MRLGWEDDFFLAGSCGAGGSFFSACLVMVLPAHAANTLGANTPSPRAVKARRRLIGGGELDVLTTPKDTVRIDPYSATTIRG